MQFNQSCVTEEVAGNKEYFIKTTCRYKRTEMCRVDLNLMLTLRECIAIRNAAAGYCSASTQVTTPDGVLCVDASNVVLTTEDGLVVQMPAAPFVETFERMVDHINEHAQLSASSDAREYVEARPLVSDGITDERSRQMVALLYTHMGTDVADVVVKAFKIASPVTYRQARVELRTILPQVSWVAKVTEDW